MEENGKFEEINKTLKQTIDTHTELITLQAVERISVVTSALASNIIVVCAGIFCLFFLSMGLGFYLSSFTGNTYFGFVIVGSFYLLVSLILSAGKKSLLEHPIRNQFIRRLFRQTELKNT
jgi:hypothetical protein